VLGPPGSSSGGSWRVLLLARGSDAVERPTFLDGLPEAQMVILADRAVGVGSRNIAPQLSKFGCSCAVYGAQHVIDKHAVSVQKTRLAFGQDGAVASQR